MTSLFLARRPQGQPTHANTTEMWAPLTLGWEKKGPRDFGAHTASASGCRIRSTRSAKNLALPLHVLRNRRPLRCGWIWPGTAAGLPPRSKWRRVVGGQSGRVAFQELSSILAQCLDRRKDCTFGGAAPRRVFLNLGLTSTCSRPCPSGVSIVFWHGRRVRVMRTFFWTLHAIARKHHHETTLLCARLEDESGYCPLGSGCIVLMAGFEFLHPPPYSLEK